MYIPKSKILQVLFRFGLRLFKIKNGVITVEEYDGPFVETSNGSYFTSTDGKTVDENSVPLYLEEQGTNREFGQLYDEYGRTPLPLLSHKPFPTEKDIQRGYMMRYFGRDKRTGQTTELHLETYQAIRVIPTYERKEIKWIIKGLKEDQLLNGYEVEGVSTLNQRTVEDLASDFPFVTDILTNPLEFYQEEQVQEQITPQPQQTPVTSQPIQQNQVTKVPKPPLQPVRYFIMDEKGQLKEVEKFGE